MTSDPLTNGLLAVFVTPTLAWAGAGAVSLPIIIHLLARRRFKRIRWAAMDFLIDAERRNRRRVRMEEWILLALRCLAMLLAGWLVARPFTTPSGFASAWGGTQRVERVFVLDDSFSMAYETPNGTLFDRAKTAVRRLIETVRRDTPDDTITLLRMTSASKPVESGASLNDAGAEDLLSRLEGLTCSQRAIELSSVFAGVVESLERDAGIVNAAVYLLSDFQRADWGSREGTAGASSVAAPLAAWASKDRALRLVLVNLGENEASNTALTAVSIPGGQIVAGAGGTVRAEIANFSDRGLDNLELAVSVENRPQPPKTIAALAERRLASVDVEAEFQRPGDAALRVETPRDALGIDNVRYAVAEVVSALRILVVNGEPSADDYDDETALLVTALRPEGEVFSGHEVVTVDEAGLEEASLPGFHAVVLANVYRIGEPTVEALERYVRQGGGLLIFLGDQVDPELYNTSLYRGGDGLLPVELVEIVKAPDAAHLVIIDRLHPALRAIGREDDPLGLAQVRFGQYFATRTPATESGAATETASRIIARFDDADARAAIVEKSFGSGRVLLITTSADKEWNLWPDHPTYVPILLELLRHVSRRGDSGSEQFVGAPIEMTVDPAAFAEEVTVRPPAYPNEPESTMTAVVTADRQGLLARWEHTESAGLYQFVLHPREGGELIRLAAVNVDPRESDLSPASETELRRAMGRLPFELVQGLDRLAEAAGESRIELWRSVAVTALFVLMMEQFLAWHWGRRR